MGGSCQLSPLQKGRAERFLVMLKGGGVTKSFRVVLTQDLEFLAILKEGLEFSTLQRGGGA